MSIPEEFRNDIEKAIDILKQEGATEIYLFGSLVEKDTIHSDSDIDIAVKGIPKNRFFSVYGKLLTGLSRSCDLVGLDYESPFAGFLLSKGQLERVA